MSRKDFRHYRAKDIWNIACRGTHRQRGKGVDNRSISWMFDGTFTCTVSGQSVLIFRSRAQK